MAKLKNKAACLISVSAPQIVTKDEKTGKVLDVQPGKTYDLMPAGEAVDVPVEKLQPGVRKWLENLIEAGQVELMSGEKIDEPSVYDGMTREDLEATAAGLNVKFTKNTTDENLKAALIKAGS